MNVPQFHILLSRAEKAGPYRMPFASDLALEEAAESLDYPMHRINLSKVTDKDGFLDAIGKALDFPDWYGHNWDALADCLRDLAWLPADGHVLLFEHAEAMQHGAGPDFDTLLGILDDAATFAQDEDRPFFAFIACTFVHERESQTGGHP